MHFSSTHQVVHYLKQKKAYIVLGGVIAVVFYCYSLIFFSKTYESSAIVYNTNNKIKSPSQAVQDANDGYTIINWVYSTELINHLISRFNIYEHFEIDTIKADAYAVCFNAVSSNVSVSTTPYGAVKISYRDRDRYFAAAITNEILSQVDKLNEQMVFAVRKQAIHEYDILLGELSRDLNSQRDSIKETILSLSNLQKTHQISSFGISNAVNTLSRTASNYESLASEWLNTRKSYLLSLKLIEKSNLPSFVIVQHALPEVPESNYTLANMGFILLVFLMGNWIMIFILLAIAKYADNLRMLLFRSYSPPSEMGETKIYPIDYIKYREEENEEISEKENVKKTL